MKAIIDFKLLNLNHLKQDITLLLKKLKSIKLKILYNRFEKHDINVDRTTKQKDDLRLLTKLVTSMF